MDHGIVILGVLCAVLALAAGIATVAAWLLAKNHRRLEHRAAELTKATERLNDQLFAVAESEERHRSLIEAQGDLIVRRTGDGEIVYANAAYARLFGKPQDALLGSRSKIDILSAQTTETRADGTQLVDECVAAPEGSRWISWAETRVPLADGGHMVQRVGRDVTSRVASQQQLDEALAHAQSANEAKSRFLATVSHEFRTPLNGIIGMADLLTDTPLDQEQTTYVRALRTSGQALLALIDEILDFAKVEAGRTILTEEPFDLVALTEGVAELLAPKAHDKGLALASYADPDMPTLVLGDADRVRQILINLIGNAIKFTQAGGVGVRLHWHESRATVVVEDTGPGIAPQRFGAIFEEFEQADETTARTHGGSGLGLAIVKRLVQLMDGSVHVDSKLGQGSAFTLELALKPVEQTPNAVAATSGLRVLIVADAPFEASYLTRKISDGGSAVTLAASPDACQSLLMSQRFDVMLIDLAMGAQQARELAILAKAAGVARRVILLSPFERRTFGPPSAAGFDAFLVKPVRGISLLAQLKDHGHGQDAIAARIDMVAPDNNQPRPRVLVAEDNEINALLARRTLEKLGAEPVWARNGKQAVDLMLAAFAGDAPPFALGVFDVRMPVMDGLAAARRIRDEESAMALPYRLPLIAVTANVSAEDRKAAMAAGFDDCLPKPMVREQLERWLKLAVDPARVNAA